MKLRIHNYVLDYRVFLSIQLIISTLIILFTLINSQSLASAMFSLSFVNLILLYLSSYCKCETTSFGLLLLIWCVISIAFSYVSGDKIITFEDLISFFTFAATIMFMMAASSIFVTKEVANSVLYIGMTSTLLYPICYFFLGANEYRRMGSLLLTMHFSSPNLAGMYLAQACLCAILGIILIKKRFVKVISMIAFGFDFYFLILSAARNSILTVLFVVAGIIYIKIKRIRKFHPLSFFIVSIMPLIFAIAYLLFIETIGSTGRLDFIVEEGKPITSRVEVWRNVFNTLKGVYWLTGDFAHLRGNLHNTHMTILGSYGIIGIVLLVKFLVDVIRNANQTMQNSLQAICLICFFGTIFMGNGENGLFYGSMGMYAIACSYLILARYDWEAEAAL